MIQILQNSLLINSAILLAVVAFLVRFFGKIISNEKPFSDDRKWEAEISGIVFLIAFVIYPAICLAMFFTGSLKLSEPDKIKEIILGWKNIVLVCLLVISLILGEVYRAKAEIFFENKKVAGFWKKVSFIVVDLFKNLGYLVVSFTLFFLLFISIGLRDIPFIFYCLLIMFFCFIFLAKILSLNGRNIKYGNIYFIDKNVNPIKGCRIIKDCESCIKIVANNDLIVLNKSVVSQIKIINNNKKYGNKEDSKNKSKRTLGKRG